MNAASVAALSVVSALTVSLGTRWVWPVEAAPQRSGGEDQALADLTRELRALRQDQASLKSELDALAARPATASPRVALGDIDEAVRSYFAAQAEAASQDGAAEEEAETLGTMALDAILATLNDPDLDWLEREELWQRVREEGRLDEVLAEFERRAEHDPNNPDSQVQLGYAYIQKIQEVGASALAGKWADLADKQFDKALALDENHWTARYMKAISLSHWPAFTGKSAEAVAQLETLVEIQSTGPLESHHEQTYLSLGNLYLGQGKDDLALDAWKKGLSLFPTSSALAAQIAALED